MDFQEEEPIEEVDLPPDLQLEINSVLSNDSLMSLPKLQSRQSTSYGVPIPYNADALSASSSSLDSLNMLMEKQRRRQLNHPHHQDFITVPNSLQLGQGNVKETSEIFLKYDPVSKRKVLNTYEIINELGHGQHGKVKLAKDLLTKQLVAIKIVDRHEKKGQKFFRIKKSNSLTQNDKIKREIAIMKKCHYKHVVKLLEVLDDSKSRKIYLVLEYCAQGEVKWCPGDQLETEARGPPLLSFQRTREILRGVVLGLEYLHYQGVIHRDIKPANLLISEDNTVKISDFGVSLAASGANSSDSSVESIDELELAKTAGTPAFFAPEICLGNDAFEKFNMTREDLFKGSSISFMIDIWALGVTLYCLLFGMLPFKSDYELELFEKIVNDPVSFPDYQDVKNNRVSRVSCQEEYQLAKDVVSKLLEKNPLKRITIPEVKKHPFVCWDFYHVQSCDEHHLTSKMDELKEFERNKEDQFKQISISKHELKNAVLGVGKKIKESVFNALPLNRNSPKVNDTLSSQIDVKGAAASTSTGDSSFIVSEGSITSNLGKFERKNDKEPHDNKQKTNDPNNDTNGTDLFKKGFSMCNDNNDHNDNYNETNKMAKEISQKELFDNELKRFDEKHDPKNVVNLPINSSFASLDSFYIDNYAMSKLGPNPRNNNGNNMRDSKTSPSIFARPPHVGGSFQHFAPNRNIPVKGNFLRRSSSRLNFLNNGLQPSRNDRIPQNTKPSLKRSEESNNDIPAKICSNSKTPDFANNRSNMGSNDNVVIHASETTHSIVPTTLRNDTNEKYKIKRGNFFSNLNDEEEETSGSSETGESAYSSCSSAAESDSGGSVPGSLPFEFADDSANGSVVSLRDLSTFDQVRPFIQPPSSRPNPTKASLHAREIYDENSDGNEENDSDESDKLILTIGKGGRHRRQGSSQTSSSSAVSSRRNTIPHLQIPRDREAHDAVDRITSAITEDSSATLAHGKYNADSQRSLKSCGDDGQATLAVPSAVMSTINPGNLIHGDFVLDRNQRSPLSFSTSSTDAEHSLLIPDIKTTPTTHVNDVSGTGHHTEHLRDNSRELLKTVLKSSGRDSSRRQSVPSLNRICSDGTAERKSSRWKHTFDGEHNKDRAARSLSRRMHQVDDNRSKSVSLAVLYKNKS
ncbi:hypothetical protein HG535_0G01930 [Zygotorulaspora mrakii]|uniref:non-specific serine/threonine protein kinase n=1 Tax=Zygotorulaspora mrakii TaxID=42260 RepID=A0A7H9B8J8_ZYGMR|nr:uncharacterized protein HG535_0G01930 [Zygotorulaspora mrakii]QLG74309.1 hypothetical protein HG535_0G01930 [Zygotorulaspora mrakii]